MSAVSKLRFVTCKRNAPISPALHRRSKLCRKLDEQIALVEGRINGVPFMPKVIRSVVDSATGVRNRIETTKRVKEWFWVGEKGRVNVQIRYGSRLLEIVKGKNAIEVSSLSDLCEALKIVREAAHSGELDSQIEAAATSLRAGFRK